MFEKEAKEYLKKDGTKAEQILNILNEISPLKITSMQLPFILAMLQQIFKDGAEFGYNKANEWHYVKDGDLPKDEEYKWCVSPSSYPYVARYEELFVSWTNQENKEVMCPYAWKEIVLPELKESGK